MPQRFTARSRRLALLAAVGALFCVLALASAAAYIASHLSSPQLITLWAAAEVAFYFLVYKSHLKKLSVQPALHRPVDHCGMSTATRFMDLRQFFPFSEDYVRSWFRWVI